MQVNVRYVNFPKPGSTGKYGSIVDQSGTRIMVPIDMLGLFQVGTIVEVATKTQTWGQGTDREALVTIATSGPQQGYTGGVQGQGPQSGYGGAQQIPGNQRANTGFQPRVIQGGPPPQHSPDQARQIFITGVVGRAMGSGKFTASEIDVLTQAAGEAFDRLVARITTRQQPAEPPPPEAGDPGPQLQ